MSVPLYSTPELEAELEAVRKIVDVMIGDMVQRHRTTQAEYLEQMAAAYLQKTGLDPEQAELVQRVLVDGTTVFYYRRRWRPDWTHGPAGSYNGSAEFNAVIDVIERGIRAQGYSIVNGHARGAARTIATNLAYDLGLAPTRTIPQNATT